MASPYRELSPPHLYPVRSHRLWRAAPQQPPLQWLLSLWRVVGGAVREAVCDSPSALWSAVTTALLTQLLALHRQWEHSPWISTGPGDSTDHRPWHGHGCSGRPHATDTNMALGCSKSNRNQHGLQGTDQTPVWSLAAPNPRRSTWLQARRQQGRPHGLHWQHGLWHLAWFLTAAQTTDIK